MFIVSQDRTTIVALHCVKIRPYFGSGERCAVEHTMLYAGTDGRAILGIYSSRDRAMAEIAAIYSMISQGGMLYKMTEEDKNV